MLSYIFIYYKNVAKTSSILQELQTFKQTEFIFGLQYLDRLF